VTHYEVLPKSLQIRKTHLGHSVCTCRKKGGRSEKKRANKNEKSKDKEAEKKEIREIRL
jgi:hypothetical protein